MPNPLAERFLDQADGHLKERNFAVAARIIDQALALEPQNIRALSLGAGIIAANGGRKEMALHLAKKALKLGPDSPVAIYNAAYVFLKFGQPHRARQLWERLTELLPPSEETLWNLAIYHDTQDDAGTAEIYFRKVMELAPRKPDLHLSLGNAVWKLGRVQEALELYREGVRLFPQNIPQSSNYLYTLQFDPACGPEQIHAEHAAWGRTLEAVVPTTNVHANDRSPDRRLRIGYVSPDFCRHAVGYSLLPLFRQHDHSQFEIYCYSNTRQPDDLTARLRQGADVWRNTVGLPDAELAAQVLQDRVDVLVDLAMHTAGARLEMFARKPAPVQVTWMAYPGSTGLTRIDYRFTDPVLDPPGLTDHGYTEQSVRLETFLCFDPPADGPEVKPLRAEKNGYVTFGCLNNFSKVNDAVLDLWREVLAAVPDSRLALILPKGKITARLREKLGVAPDRLIGLPRQPRLEYLKYYHRIDLALDPFPYTGLASSFDCLWMGVPLITLPGHTVGSRCSLSLLSKIGLTELAAKDKTDYVALAVAFARDPARLSELRSGLRGRLQSSVLMDASRFARQAESAYRTVWHKWCENFPES
jgi:predicted O-linked N-acetylglucosamine transferase (SPINDLY family)